MVFQVPLPSTSLTAVATVMFVTTTLITMVMYFVWAMKLVFPVVFCFVFGGLELLFWTGNARTHITLFPKMLHLITFVGMF